METAPVTAVIVHYTTDEFTHHLVSLLLTHCSKVLRSIVVVDNCSPLPYQPQTYDARIRILRMDENKGYAAACNAGVAQAVSPYYFILNSDLDFNSDALTPLIETMNANPKVGIAGPKLAFEDGRFQLSFGEDPALLTEYREKKRQRQSTIGKGALYEARKKEALTHKLVDWITGAAMLIRKEAFDAVKGFDEDFFFYFEDSDFCRRVRRAGFSVIFVPFATIVHYGGGSQSGFNPAIIASYRLGQLRYYRKYNGKISFYLLKIYLCTVFGVRSIQSGTNFAFYTQMCRLLWTFPYTPVRSN